MLITPSRARPATRWMCAGSALTQRQRHAALLALRRAAGVALSVNALSLYGTEDLNAGNHAFELPRRDYITLNLDLKQQGVGRRQQLGRLAARAVPHSLPGLFLQLSPAALRRQSKPREVGALTKPPTLAENRRGLTVPAIIWLVGAREDRFSVTPALSLGACHCPHLWMGCFTTTGHSCSESPITRSDLRGRKPLGWPVYSLPCPRSISFVFRRRGSRAVGGSLEGMGGTELGFVARRAAEKQKRGKRVAALSINRPPLR